MGVVVRFVAVVVAPWPIHAEDLDRFGPAIQAARQSGRNVPWEWSVQADEYRWVASAKGPNASQYADAAQRAEANAYAWHYLMSAHGNRGRPDECKRQLLELYHLIGRDAYVAGTMPAFPDVARPIDDCHAVLDSRREYADWIRSWGRQQREWFLVHAKGVAWSGPHTIRKLTRTFGR